MITESALRRNNINRDCAADYLEVDKNKTPRGKVGGGYPCQRKYGFNKTRYFSDRENDAKPLISQIPHRTVSLARYKTQIYSAFHQKTVE